MNGDDIERLIAERSLVRQEFDDAEVAGFLLRAETSFADARAAGLSPEGRLQLAYTAGLQVTFAVLAAVGLRVKSSASHYKAFYAAQRLGDDFLRVFAARLDDLRQVRHQSEYEPIEDERAIENRSTEAVAVLEEALPRLRQWLLQRRPALAPEPTQDPALPADE